MEQALPLFRGSLLGCRSLNANDNTTSSGTIPLFPIAPDRQIGSRRKWVAVSSEEHDCNLRPSTDGRRTAHARPMGPIHGIDEDSASAAYDF
jgi:hypothetical protein